MSFGPEQEGVSLITPWLWHILSILLTAVRGISAETCGLDHVFPPDDLCYCLETLVLIYIYLYVCILYTSSVIGRIYTYTKSVAPYW